MTREEAIERWQDVVQAVFCAEERISNEWYDKFKDTPSLPKEEQHKLAMDYCKAIAVEIVSNTSDEQLKQMK